GYTPDLVSILWVGSDEHVRLHHKTSGADTALPIWDDYMTKVIKSRPKPPPFVRPHNVVSASIHPKFGSRSAAGMRMWFIRGNEPAAESEAMEALSHLEEAS